MANTCLDVSEDLKIESVTIYEELFILFHRRFSLLLVFLTTFLRCNELKEKNSFRIKIIVTNHSRRFIFVVVVGQKKVGRIDND